MLLAFTYWSLNCSGNWHSFFPMACTPSTDYVSIMHQMIYDCWKITSLKASAHYEQHSSSTHKRVWDNQNYTFQYTVKHKKKASFKKKITQISRKSVKYNLQLPGTPCSSDLYDSSNLLLNSSDSVTYLLQQFIKKMWQIHTSFHRKCVLCSNINEKKPQQTKHRHLNA